MGPTWGPSGADRTQVGPMLAPWTLLSGMSNYVVSTVAADDLAPLGARASAGTAIGKCASRIITNTGGKMKGSHPRAADRCPFVPRHSYVRLPLPCSWECYDVDPVLRGIRYYDTTVMKVYPYHKSTTMPADVLATLGASASTGMLLCRHGMLKNRCDSAL